MQCNAMQSTGGGWEAMLPTKWVGEWASGRVGEWASGTAQVPLTTKSTSLILVGGVFDS